jgi:hypothetical protein
VISAALSVTIDLTTTTCTYDEATGEYSCATTDLGNAALTVSLKGSGDTYRGNSMQSFHGGPFHAVSHSSGAYRAADVAMSLTLNGADLLADAGGGWGELDQATSGSTSIDRY